jgi:very-short-patch-repair endonuclease
VNDTLYAHITHLAQGQHGLVTRTQLAELGCTLSRRRSLLQRQLLHQLTPEVFATAGSPATWERLVRCALLSIGGHVRCSRATAAAFLRFEGYERRGVVHVVIPRSQRVSPARIPEGVVVHTTTTLRQLDCAVLDGIPITSAARTILDLAGDGAGARDLERAIDSAVRDGWTSVAFLHRQLTALRSRGRAGIRAIERLLPDSGGHSTLERQFLRLVRTARLPRPTCQRVFTRDGVFVARTDFTFGDRRAIVEVTGRLGHTTSRNRQHDAQRRNELQDIGYKVFEYTYEDVTERPDYVVRTLRTRLGLP